MTTIIFYKASAGDWKDKLVSAWTFGPYSHCELYFPETNLCYSCSPRENCVRYKEIDIHSGHWDILEVPINVDKTSCDNLLGKKYDWEGLIFTQIFPFKIQNPNEWFCSELCAFEFGISKPYRFNPNGLYRKLVYDYNLRKL